MTSERVRDFFWFLLGCVLAGCVASLLSCATTGEAERPTPEQMPQGRVICQALCASYGREYKEYHRDGKCECRSAVTEM